MKVSIVVPTFEEKENIPLLFERIFKVFKISKINGEIIVVDDDSQDGTANVVKEYCKKYPIKLIVRKGEKGLASACVEGFKVAKGDVIIVMDADLQHPPEKIPTLIDTIKDGADIAIASRYIEGGTTGEWDLSRKVVSKGASALANLLFKEIKGIKDQQSGFFAFKKKVIEGVKLKPKGYKILLEILVLGKHKKVEEIAYEFGERTSGKSKLGFSTIFSYLSHIIRLLWASGKLTKLIKFCMVGLLGVGVNLGILYFLTSLGLYYMISGAISIEISLLTNFFLNRAWTFKEEAKYVSMKNAIAKDHITRAIGILIQFASLYVFTELFNMYYILSMTIGIIISTIWNFVGNSRWVWKSEKQPNA